MACCRQDFFETAGFKQAQQAHYMDLGFKLQVFIPGNGFTQILLCWENFIKIEKRVKFEFKLLNPSAAHMTSAAYYIIMRVLRCL
jgi:hypothetical protein